jgi:hypothetical protein
MPRPAPTLLTHSRCLPAGDPARPITHLVRGRLAGAVAHIQPRACTHQRPHSVHMAIPRSKVQRRFAQLAGTVHMRPHSHQRIHHTRVAALGGMHQRSAVHQVPAIHVSAQRHQLKHYLHVARIRRGREWRQTRSAVHPVHSRTRRCQTPHLRNVTLAGRHHQLPAQCRHLPRLPLQRTHGGLRTEHATTTPAASTTTIHFLSPPPPPRPLRVTPERRSENVPTRRSQQPPLPAGRAHWTRLPITGTSQPITPAPGPAEADF